MYRVGVGSEGMPPVDQLPACSSLVPSPMPMQLFVACSMVKRGGPGTFPHVSMT